MYQPVLYMYFLLYVFYKSVEQSSAVNMELMHFQILIFSIVTVSFGPVCLGNLSGSISFKLAKKFEMGY